MENNTKEATFTSNGHDLVMEKPKQSFKTFEEIVEFSNAAYQYLESAEGETKLTYALRKLAGDPKTNQKGTLVKYIKTAQGKAEDLKIDFAAEDATTKVILKDSKGNFEYTKEGRKALTKALNSLNDELIEIEPHYVVDMDITSLTEAQRELFKGFVLN